MLFLRNKKKDKIMEKAWGVIGVLVIGSMVLLYLPGFF